MKQDGSEASGDLFSLKKEDVDTCHDMKNRFKVHPGFSWGSLPADLQRKWKSLDCDFVF